MGNLYERSLIRFGAGGLVVGIPKPWAAFYGLKPADVEVITNHELVVKSKHKQPARDGRGAGGGQTRE